MDLPIIKLTINEDDETRVEKVSFVDDPAIERQWMAFKSDKNPFKFAADEEQRVVSGPLMVAGLPIYRFDEKFGEYYVQFDAATIKNIVLKFHKEQRMASVNLMHEVDVEDVFMFESFIIDERKPTPKGFETMPNGSWFGSFKVNNDEVWAKVKSGEFQRVLSRGNL
jgi:ABC-type thiamine transport system ATPase subunit